MSKPTEQTDALQTLRERITAWHDAVHAYADGLGTVGALMKCGADLADDLAAVLPVLAQQQEKSTRREVQLGVIEFHSERVNPGLIKRFYAIRDDLTAAGCIVDLWLMDIATVLGEFGYEMKVLTNKPLPKPCYERLSDV